MGQRVTLEGEFGAGSEGRREGWMLERFTRSNPQNVMTGSMEEGGRQTLSPTCIYALSDQGD